MRSSLSYTVYSELAISHFASFLMLVCLTFSSNSQWLLKSQFALHRECIYYVVSGAVCEMSYSLGT